MNILDAEQNDKEIKMTYKDKLIDYYGYQEEIFSKSYRMMGLLLDKKFVKREVEEKELFELYIYGGGYLGIQLYNALRPIANVVSIVDKRGRLLIDVEDIPVIDMCTFRNQYKNEPIIVTPIKFYNEIYYELKDFVPQSKIIFLEEFGGLQ